MTSPALPLPSDGHRLPLAALELGIDAPGVFHVRNVSRRTQDTVNNHLPRNILNMKETIFEGDLARRFDENHEVGLRYSLHPSSPRLAARGPRDEHNTGKALRALISSNLYCRISTVSA